MLSREITKEGKYYIEREYLLGCDNFTLRSVIKKENYLNIKDLKLSKKRKFLKTKYRTLDKELSNVVITKK
jgi:hypothetical protein